MKKQFNAAISRQNKTLIDILILKRFNWTGQPLFFLIMLFGTFLFTACKKYAADKPAAEEQTTVSKNEISTEAELAKHYSELNPQTLSELQQVHAATAKYQNISNAFADNYGEDPIVVLPNMGYHFLKAELVSPVFDVKKPAILVYNKKENGNFELVAVEYAVPMSSLPLHVAPEGFTGDADEWNENTLNSGWWTLHAWVWEANPDGVFKPMNPLVIVR